MRATPKGKWPDLGRWDMAGWLELGCAVCLQHKRRDWNPLQLYEDLYLTEQPYGFVSGVATDLPDND